MTKKWEVTVNGINNVIEYKTGFGAKILVNGQAYKVKSQNWFVMMVDYPITIDGTEFRVVAIGNKVDLAVNGVYHYGKHQQCAMFFWGLAVLPDFCFADGLVC